MLHNPRKSNSHKLWKKWAWVLLLLAVFFANRGFRLLIRNWLALHRINSQKGFLSKKIQEESVELKQLSDPAVLELKARKELDFIKKGEIEYRFTPPHKS